ncbi:unnamed protein product [Calypogeia fissa]
MMARPPLDAPEEFVIWWDEKVAEHAKQELEQEQVTIKAAPNAVAVTAALVATASYLGPFQPPLGYGADSMQQLQIMVTTFQFNLEDPVVSSSSNVLNIFADYSTPEINAPTAVE